MIFTRVDLPAPFSPKQRVDLAGLQAQVDIVVGPQVAEELDDVAGFENVRARSRPVAVIGSHVAGAHPTRTIVAGPWIPLVMPGHVPGIHVLFLCCPNDPWMAGTSPTMTWWVHPAYAFALLERVTMTRLPRCAFQPSRPCGAAGPQPPTRQSPPAASMSRRRCRSGRPAARYRRRPGPLAACG